MATYIHVQSKTYPLYEADIRRRHPNVSFPHTLTPETLKDFGYEVVYPTTKPEGDVVSMGFAAYNSDEDKYFQTWVVREFSKDEKKNVINMTREKLLKEGIEYTFPNGVVDRVQVTDRDLTILQSIEFRAIRNIDSPDYRQIFRAMSNTNYSLTAQEVVNMTTSVFEAIEKIYIDSWMSKE